MSITNKSNFEMHDEKSTIFKILKKEKIIIPDTTDELSLIRTNYEKLKRKEWIIAIATTLNCNFSCSYCFQNKTNKNMSIPIATKIIEYIKNQKYPLGSNIHFQWIGGEPLLNKKVIYFISNQLNDIDYNATLYTNGYLIDKKIINDLKRLRINTIYITIDGHFSSHDKKRFLKNGGVTYEVIKENILNINEKWNDKIKIIIKTNLDKDNFNSYPQLISDFKNCKNIKFNYTPVYPTSFQSSLDESVFTTNEFDLIDDQAYDLLIQNNLAERKVPNPRNYGCPAYMNSIAFDAEGNIYKCIEGIGTNNYIIGKIDNSNFIFFEEKTELWTNYNIFEDKDCINCSFFPICMGGCLANRLKLNKDLEKKDCKSYKEKKLKQMLNKFYETI
jgi:uncharacterized protein